MANILLSDTESWLPEKEALQDMLRAFLDIYAARPVPDNAGGVSSVGAFSLWYFLKHVQPTFVVESGVWRGQTTWIIEQALPDVEIVCFDPSPQVRLYTSQQATYPAKDFSQYLFSSEQTAQGLCFFDDHQDALRRTVQARRKGFKQIIYDDNYPPGSGGHRSIAHCVHQNGRAAHYLSQVIADYRIFPPLYNYNEPITDEQIVINLPTQSLDDIPELAVYREQMSSYRWMSYVQLKDVVDENVALKFYEWEHRNLTGTLSYYLTYSAFKSFSGKFARRLHRVRNNA